MSRSVGFLKGLSTPGSARSELGSSHSKPPAERTVVDVDGRVVTLWRGWWDGVKEREVPRRAVSRRSRGGSVMFGGCWWSVC